jgi:hypothetical protein
MVRVANHTRRAMSHEVEDKVWLATKNKVL